MINFKFTRSQLKNIITPLIILFVILIILILPALTQGYFAPAREVGNSGSIPIMGGELVIRNIFFGIPGFVTIAAFSIILSHILVSREIDRGYLASWLTLPISRKVILNSKFFVLISSLLVVYLSAFLFQVVFFLIFLKDFNFEVFARLALYNFSFILLVLLWTSISWMIICAFNKPSKSLSLASAIATLFIVCAVMIAVSSVNPHFLKYFTITSFVNSPFKYADLPTPPPDFRGIISAELLKINTLDFAWQLPVMLTLSIGLFPLSKLFISKRDLNL